MKGIGMESGYREMVEREYRRVNAAYIGRKNRSGFAAFITIASIIAGILTLVCG